MACGFACCCHVQAGCSHPGLSLHALFAAFSVLRDEVCRPRSAAQGQPTHVRSGQQAQVRAASAFCLRGRLASDEFCCMSACFHARVLACGCALLVLPASFRSALFVSCVHWMDAHAVVGPGASTRRKPTRPPKPSAALCSPSPPRRFAAMCSCLRCGVSACLNA